MYCFVYGRQLSAFFSTGSSDCLVTIQAMSSIPINRILLMIAILGTYSTMYSYDRKWRLTISEPSEDSKMKLSVHLPKKKKENSVSCD